MLLATLQETLQALCPLFGLGQSPGFRGFAGEG